MKNQNIKMGFALGTSHATPEFFRKTGTLLSTKRRVSPSAPRLFLPVFSKTDLDLKCVRPVLYW